MHIRRLRLDRGWSQDQMAAMAGISTRTLQRIERGATPSAETLKCLAAVLEIDFSDLRQELDMPTDMAQIQERETLEYVRDIKGFYTHALSFVVVTTVLAVANLVFTPEYLWVGWTYLGWGLGLLAHGQAVYEWIDLFGPQWERRQVEKRLNRTKSRLSPGMVGGASWRNATRAPRPSLKPESGPPIRIPKPRQPKTEQIA